MKNHNLFDDWYIYDEEDLLHELQNIDRSSVSSLHKEHDCLQRTEFEIYFLGLRKTISKEWGI